MTDAEGSSSTELMQRTPYAQVYACGVNARGYACGVNAAQVR